MSDTTDTQNDTPPPAPTEPPAKPLSTHHRKILTALRRLMLLDTKD